MESLELTILVTISSFLIGFAVAYYLAKKFRPLTYVGYALIAIAIFAGIPGLESAGWELARVSKEVTYKIVTILSEATKAILWYAVNSGAISADEAYIKFLSKVSGTALYFGALLGLSFGWIKKVVVFTYRLLLRKRVERLKKRVRTRVNVVTVKIKLFVESVKRVLHRQSSSPARARSS